jgi:hypothetical protein
LILLSSGVGRLKAVKEEVMVPVGGCVLKALECGGDWGEALLPKVMLEYLDAIPVGGEGVAGIDSRGVFLDKQKNVTNT